MKTSIVAVFWVVLSIGASAQQHAFPPQDQTAAPQPQTAAPQPATAAPTPQTATPGTQIAAADPQAATPQAQPATPQAQPAGQTPAAAGGQDQGPTIKDPNEYNAYIGALQQKDNNAKISAFEAFLTQYPNSVMKTTALEQLMGAYQQTGNQTKVVDTAKRVLTADACNLRALALLTYLSRQSAAAGQNPQQSVADLAQYANKGVDCLKNGTKPATMSESDWDTLKKQTEVIFEGGAGFAALQNKDWANAQTHLRAAVHLQPDDIQNVYPLALAYLSATPPDSVNGLFFIARAANLAQGAGQQQIQSYGQKTYKNYHGSEDGWTDVLAKAKTTPEPPADFAITKYVPPTPAEQAHDIVKDKTPEQIKQLSFGEWELVLSAGTPDDQAKVWDVIKNVPLQMEGNVIEATSNTELHIAASADDIDAKRADITLTMSGPIPAIRMPKVGDTFDFEGTPTAYTPTPFMMTMDTGKLLKKAGAPAPKKAPVHHRPAHPSQQ